MKSTKSVKWESKDGSELEVRITATCEMRTETAYADGWNVDLGKKEYKHTDIKVYIDGKFYKDSYAPSLAVEPNYMKKTVDMVKAAGCVALMANSTMAITQERYDEIMAAIKEAEVEASKDEEYTAYIESKKAAEEAAKPAKEAAEKELKETEIPAAAVKAYNHYHGDENKAWEDENETAWALIRK